MKRRADAFSGYLRLMPNRLLQHARGVGGGAVADAGAHFTVIQGGVDGVLEGA